MGQPYIGIADTTNTAQCPAHKRLYWKTPQKHAGPYKSAELKTQEMLVRLGDLEKRMDADERNLLEAPRNKVQEIHDAWFEGIMSKKK